MKGSQANNPVQTQAAIDAAKEYERVHQSILRCYNDVRRWSERRCMKRFQNDVDTAFGLLLGAIDDAYMAGEK